MLVKRGTGGNVYNRWRPWRFEEFVGNSRVILAVQKLLERKEPPQSWMFHGPSGTGKTSMARVVAAMLNCSVADSPCLKCESCLNIMNGSSSDYAEINAAEKRGIDAMRELIQQMRYMPVGKRRVYVLDECHMMTRDASNALLKVYEDCIGTNLIVLCTTQPMDVLQTLRTRAVTFEFKLWTREEMIEAAECVFHGEGFTKISTKSLLGFVDRACELGLTSPRAFLNAIDKVLSSGSFAVLDSLSGAAADVKSICTSMMNGDWSAIAAGWSDSLEPEQVRMAACAYLKNALLREASPTRALNLAEALKELAHRVDDTAAENNVLARLCLATLLLAETKREDVE